MIYQHKYWLIWLLLLAGACSGLPIKPVKPQIKLISIAPLNISLSEQQLRFELEVTNPNNFALPVQSVDFVASFNETDFASGKSNHTPVIPANGKATLMIDVTAGIDRLMTTLQTILHRQTLNLNYELRGSVEIQNWPAAIPFSVSGALDSIKLPKVKNSQ